MTHFRDRQLLAGTALILSASLCGCTITRSGQEFGRTPSGPVTHGLQMALAISKSSRPGDPEFEVTIRNVGNQDVCLNLGQMLANGKVMLPTQIYFKVIDGGKIRDLHLKAGEVAGRLDNYAVPLRAGSVYSLELHLNQFWCPQAPEFASRLNPGHYEISAQFQGEGAEIANMDMAGIKLLNFWKGTLPSNVLPW